MSRSQRVQLIVILAIIGVVASLVLPPLKQPQSYHHFADEREFFGIPNFWNVISNGGFLVVGVWGLGLVCFASARRYFVDPVERWAYAMFFFGVVLTCFGSGYYHWKPADATLVWDRLPMTLGFMSMLSVTVSERISVKWGARLLAPLVAAGVASVWWWQQTGNLWPYAAAQYWSLLLIVLMLLLFPARYTRGVDLAFATGFYVLAKVFEALDNQIYQILHVVSGHSLKHLVTAVATFWILRMLWKRSPVMSESGQ